MIQLPIEIGDTILAGKFKNKKIIVREIGLDDFGLPTINGRGILKIRIPKLYVKENTMKKINEGSTDSIPVKIKKEDDRYFIYVQYPDKTEKCITNVGFETEDLALHSVTTKGYTLVNDKNNPKDNKFTEPPKAMAQRSNEFKLSEASLKTLKRLIVEVLSEVEITDEDTTKKLEELALLSDQMDKLKSDLAKLKARFDPLDEEITALMEEATKMGERAMETKTVLVTIKRKGYEAKSVKWKEFYTAFYSKLNGRMRKQADALMAANTEIKKYATTLAVQYKKQENVVNEESLVGRILTKIKSWFSSKLSQLTKQGKDIDTDIATLKRIA